MRQYYSLMATGDDDRSEVPEYNVYRSGGGRSGGGSGPPQDSAKSSGDRPEDAGSPGGAGEPDYRVYRASRNPLSKLRSGEGTSLREKLGRGGSGDGGTPKAPRAPGSRPLWRRVLKWVVIAAAAWFLLSVVLFAVSAQIQKGKLDDDTADLLGGNPLLAAIPQNILVIGTDARPEATGNPEAETREKCINQGATGQAPSSDCAGFRADTLMVVRAGGGAFEKLSIPRDTLAEIPGLGAEKINSAYANGGAALQVETVENFLGIDIDHVVLLDFQGFAEFIDAIGGVTVDVGTRVKSEVDGGSGQGGITLKLERGEQELTGDQALAYARTRTNEWNPSENDLDRARRQQEVLAGIKSRLTSITRLPINFLRGPLIAWNAPKAMVTDMGALTLPQLAIALAIGGEQGTQILGKTGSTISAAGNIVISQEECERALTKFLGEKPDEPPPCSPPA